MTQQSNDNNLPEITKEEDSPFYPNNNAENQRDELSKETNPIHGIDWQKFTLGSNTLGWCLFLMFLCIIFAGIWPENKLVDNAFEAFKLIVMTILGYLFGSNTSEKK